MKNAVLFGASGLVGSHVLKKLEQDRNIEKITVFNRRSLYENYGSKVNEVINDLEDLKEIEEKIKGDILFICLGTTIKKAGSQEKFKAIDFELPLEIAQIAKRNGIDTCLVISSLGANAESSNFYLKVKGKMENALQNLAFNHLVILRPSMLLGNRSEFRLGEWIGKNLMSFFSFLFIGRLKKYKAIHAKTVASVMLAEKDTHEKVLILDSDLIQQRLSS